MSKFTESTVEAAALEWLGGLGYSVAAGPDLLDGLFAERSSGAAVVLEKRMSAALTRINQGIPHAAIAEAHRKLANIDALLAVDRNHRFHHAVVNGVAVEYPKGDGSIGYTNVAIVDFAQPDNNDWLAVNQFTVVDGRHHRRPDIVLFLNGFPVALVELKNAADEDADLPGAFQQARLFSALLEKRLREYQNRALTTAEIIDHLIELAKEMNAANRRGEELGLSEDELAFYDALEANDSAVAVLGDETLRMIARELVETVKQNVTIDWTVRESVQANLRRLVKRTLKKYGYPPDKQEQATTLVLQQAALHAEEWAA